MVTTIHTTPKATILASELAFTECPRWYADRLWFSDMYTNWVYSLEEDKNLTALIEVPGRPAGLGWTETGELLVVSMQNQALLRYRGTELQQTIDLSPFVSGHCNDMVVSDDDNAYIGNFGFDFEVADATPAPANLLRVTKTGEVHVAATDMHFPNGSVIINQGQTLVVAETMGGVLTAFDIAPNGELHNRRVWAALEPASSDESEMQAWESTKMRPDGIAADAQDGIWVATLQPYLVRVVEGGQITHRVDCPHMTVACEVGGQHGEYLYVCTTEHLLPEDCLKHKSSAIIRIDTPR